MEKVREREREGEREKDREEVESRKAIRESGKSIRRKWESESLRRGNEKVTIHDR